MMAVVSGQNTYQDKGLSAGMMRVMTPDALTKQIEAASQTNDDLQNTPKHITLSSIIEAAYQNNLSYKQEMMIDEQMIENLRQRDGSYPTDKLNEIKKQGGTDVFMGLTNVKCRAAESWLTDIFMSGLDKPWSLEPTPIPELPIEIEQIISQRAISEWMNSLQGQPMTPDEVFETSIKIRAEVENDIDAEAARIAGRMEKKIEEQFEAGNFNGAMDDFITDLVTLKAGILKGPVVSSKKILTFKKGAMGRKVPVVEEKIVTEFQRVSPFDIFPSRGAITPNDGEFIQKCKFTPKSLIAVRDIPGYYKIAIDAVLEKYREGGLRVWSDIDQQRIELEKKGTNVSEQKNLIEGLEYWGSQQGKYLLENGIHKDNEGKPLQPMSEYEINAIKIGGDLIYCQLNPDPLGRRPYYKTGYTKIPGSFWYKGVPDLMADLQKICNAAIRAMVNNMGIASGPQVVIEDINRLARKQNISSMHPWQIWQLVNPTNSTAPGVTFHNIESNASELMNIYDKFSMIADDYTGIPAYMYGSDKAGGAGETLGGLEILMNSAKTGIKKVIYRIDREVIAPAIESQYTWNMLYDEDESAKGDVEIKAVGALGLIVKEQMAARRMQYLDTTNNPTDIAIMGPERRANILRKTASSVGLKEDEVAPDKQQMKARVAAMAQAAMAEQHQQSLTEPQPAQ